MFDPARFTPKTGSVLGALVALAGTGGTGSAHDIKDAIFTERVGSCAD